MTVLNVGQYNIYNKHNNYQPGYIQVFNLRNIVINLYFDNNMSINDYQSILNNFTSKIEKKIPVYFWVLDNTSTLNTCNFSTSTFYISIFKTSTLDTNIYSRKCIFSKSIFNINIASTDISNTNIPNTSTFNTIIPNISTFGISSIS